MDKAYLQQYVKKINGDKEAFTKFFTALRGGENKVLHNMISQTVMLDDSWIIQLESTLTNIEHIVRNPRKFIAEDEFIQDVAKVRRTNSRTVRHLTSHSQYVQNIEKNGDVRPKKLLTVELDEDLAIYENRFICALVNRIIKFVEQRHNDLDGKMDNYEQTNVCLQSEFGYGKSKFRCNINLQVEQPIEGSDDIDKNKDLFERVETIRRRLRVLQTTEFMKILNKAKPVRPPIQKTNLLNKNVDYNACYKLWLYISSYTYLGYSIEASDKNLPVDGDYYDDLTVLAGLSLQSLISNNVLNKEEYDKIEYSEPVERDYELVKNYTFTPDFDSTKEQAGAETINEYYYRRMKDELTAAAKEGAFEIEKNLSINFTKFFRSVSRINEEMYGELIEEQLSANKPKEEDLNAPLAKKRAEIEAQKERLRRRKLYLKLKWEEVERAQRMVERAEAKLGKLKDDLHEEKKKTTPKHVSHKKLKTIKRAKRG